jgi:methionine-rich copper-binding protein CopC
MAGPDIQISLRFNSRIDGRRSSLVLVAPNGEQRTLVIAETTAPDSLGSQATGLTGGSYVLRWQVLAADGHISRGEVPFSVR